MIERKLPADDAQLLFGPRVGARGVADTPGYNGRGRLLRDEFAAPLEEWVRQWEHSLGWFHPPDLELELELDFRSRSTVELQVMREEWAFLQTQSLVASRLKRRFSEFVRAGAIAVEVGRRTLDRLEARTLRLPPTATVELRAVHHLRASAKWIAAGGPPAVTLIEPLIGIPLQIVGPLFVLLDP